MDKVHMVELIPANETLQNWTLMGNTMSLQGAQSAPMEVVMNLMIEQAKVNSDNVKLTLVEKGESIDRPWILFKIEASSFKNDKKPESQLYYITAGKTALFTNFIAVREAKLKQKFVEKWSKVFKESELVME
ncbi:MAG TPA: hypothetical protein VGB44_02040 [Flavobacterium sp.]